MAARSKIVQFSCRATVMEQLRHTVDRGTHWAVSEEKMFRVSLRILNLNLLENTSENNV